MQANSMGLHTPLTPGVGSKVKIIFSFASDHVAYHIKGNEMYNNIDEFDLTHTWSLGLG